MPLECFFNFEIEVDLEAEFFDTVIAEVVVSEATTGATEECCATEAPSLTTRNNAMRARVAKDPMRRPNRDSENEDYLVEQDNEHQVLQQQAFVCCLSHRTAYPYHQYLSQPQDDSSLREMTLDALQDKHIQSNKVKNNILFFTITFSLPFKSSSYST